MERIANPVTGRVDDDTRPAPPPTRLMVLCRYGFALLIPVFVLIDLAVAPTREPGDWWMPLVPLLVAFALLAAGAQGSWWGPAPRGAWQAGMLAELGAILVGAIVALVVGPLAMTVTMILLIGAVLGIGAAQLWRSLPQRPRSGAGVPAPICGCKRPASTIRYRNFATRARTGTDLRVPAVATRNSVRQSRADRAPARIPARLLHQRPPSPTPSLRAPPLRIPPSPSAPRPPRQHPRAPGRR